MSRMPTKTTLSNNGAELAQLGDFFAQYRRIFVLTGAGISTASGIPDYRDHKGEWKRKTPIQHQDFIDKAAVRKRYWARSLLGWRYFGKAAPSAGHLALAQLEEAGHIALIVTQNVDGLHQRAGSKNVIDLHGRIGHLLCLECGARSTRAEFQPKLEAHNSRYTKLAARIAPDGDADLDLDSFDDFNVPACEHCDGVIMPDVVFYGGSVPKPRVAQAFAGLDAADAVLVAGSSLMVYSGYRFCKAAAEQGKPIAAINLGVTRADDLLAFKVEMPCCDALQSLLPGPA